MRQYLTIPCEAWCHRGGQLIFGGFFGVKATTHVILSYRKLSADKGPYRSCQATSNGRKKFTIYCRLSDAQKNTRLHLYDRYLKYIYIKFV